MNFSQLRAFIAVAQSENLTMAAEKLYTSQSNLSKSLKKLEDEVGVPLFKRPRGRTVLSEYGRYFLERAEKNVNDMDECVEHIRSMNRNAKNEIFIGASRRTVVSSLIHQFVLAHEDCSVYLMLDDPQVLVNKLIGGELDFAVIYEPILEPQVEWRPYINDEIGVILHKGHPLYERKYIDLTELKTSFFINDDTVVSTDMLTRLCQEAGFQPKIRFSSNDAKVNVNLARTPQFVSLGSLAQVARGHIEDDEPDVFNFIRMERPRYSRSIGIAKLSERELTGSARNLYDVIQRGMININKRVIELTQNWQ